LDDHIDKKRHLIPLDKKIYDLGYLRSNRKPGLCYKKCISGVAFLDYRNIGEVPREIQVEEGPQFRFKVEKPYWKSVRTRELQKKLLDENKIKFRLSFYATLERLDELNEGKNDGYCKFCNKDFEDDGLFCSQECAIHTELNLDSDNESGTSAVREDIRVLVDGDPVPISYTGDTLISDVTLCSRAYQIDTNVLSTLDELCTAVENIDGVTYSCPEDIYFDSYIATKQAHGWTFVALDVGSGEHYIEVQALLADNVTVNGKNSKNSGDSTTPNTILEVGKANLIVTEEKLATGTQYPGQ